MSEVFASGILFGFAAAWSHMLLTFMFLPLNRQQHV